MKIDKNRLSGGSRPSDSFLSIFEWLDYADGAFTGLMVTSGGVLFEGYGHGGPGGAAGRRAAPAYATIPDLT